MFQSYILSNGQLTIRTHYDRKCSLRHTRTINKSTCYRGAIGLNQVNTVVTGCRFQTRCTCHCGQTINRRTCAVRTITNGRIQYRCAAGCCNCSSKRTIGGSTRRGFIKRNRNAACCRHGHGRGIVGEDKAGTKVHSLARAVTVFVGSGRGQRDRTRW